MIASFKACQEEGEPLVHFGRHQVLREPPFQDPALRARIVWFYSEEVRGWNEACRRRAGRSSSCPELKRFPHYRTTFENLPQPIHLEPVQINALAHLSSCCILRTAERIRRFFEI